MYDNVSVNESIEAAKARSVSRSQNHSSNSHHTSEIKTVNNGSILSSSSQNNKSPISNSSNNTNQNNNQNNNSVDNQRKEQSELIEKIAKLNQSVSSENEQVFIQKSEKTFIVEDHRKEDVVTTEFSTTKSTFISVNNYTIENSTFNEHHKTVEPKRNTTPIRINTNSNGNNGKIEHQPTSPSKIRIFVPYSETNETNDTSPNSTAKGLPAVET